MANTVDPELSVALSYCNLFQSNRSKEVQVASTADETSNAATATTPETEFTPWKKDDAWSDADGQQAATQLQQDAAKCQIPVSLVQEDDETAWNRFYEQHLNNFFKDRHYLATDFPVEFSPNKTTRECWVEVGCGVGNALLPILANPAYASWTIYGLDLSETAVKVMKRDARFVAAAESGRAFAWPCDISAADATSTSACTSQSSPIAQQQSQQSSRPARATIPLGVATVTSLLFCLSAIHPDHHATAVGNVAAMLANEGTIIFRDYGRYDQAQMNLGRQRRKLVTDSFYRKGDGTKCFYFTLEELRALMEGAGLEVIELEYLRRVYYNRANGGTERRRVWVQGRFRKPAESTTH